MCRAWCPASCGSVSSSIPSPTSSSPTSRWSSSGACRMPGPVWCWWGCRWSCSRSGDTSSAGPSACSSTMSERIAIRLSGVGKMYKVFPSRLDNLLDALGVERFLTWRGNASREFWALRDIDIELKAGSRLGIIGRNGAGKSTLLKLITGNIAPTEGQVAVNGQVQALLEAGAGFHPEFTGYENIRAALTYQGLHPTAIEAAVQEIEEFTELGQFLAQPFKTYSTGMQA